MNCLDPPCSPFFQIVGYEVGWYLVGKDFLYCLFKVFSLLVLVQIWFTLFDIAIILLSEIYISS